MKCVLNYMLWLFFSVIGLALTINLMRDNQLIYIFTALLTTLFLVFATMAHGHVQEAYEAEKKQEK